MNPISVVIITRNEEANIRDCIASAKLVSDDIVVVDSCSTDNTTRIARNLGARVLVQEWKGYGYARNQGADAARHDWILALDADERVESELALSLNRLSLCVPDTIYFFRRINFLNGKQIRFGTAGFETVRRLYHRKHASWDLSLVHEKLVAASGASSHIRGHLTHFGMKTFDSYRAKLALYASMSAEKYLAEGRKAGIFKKTFSPLFNSLKSYLFLLGFLDGREGWFLARTIAWYSWCKYDCLNALRKERSEAANGESLQTFSTKPAIETLPT